MYLRDVADPDHDQAYGTASPDAPVTRADFERALRALHASDLRTHDQLLHLAAQVVALTDELTRRLDGVEPKPAPPETPAESSALTVETTVAMMTDDTLSRIRANDANQDNGVSFEMGGDKYTVQSESPPCEELIHLCKARCCTLRFALSTQDLDEGIIRWDYGRPYMIRQRASDEYCVHNDPETHHCTVHAARPRVCRTYHCRDDKRIWLDYEQRIPGPDPDYKPAPFTFNLMDRARARTVALFNEHDSLEKAYPDRDPRRGPKL